MNAIVCMYQQRLGLVCIEYGKLDYKAMAWTFCEAQTLESGEVYLVLTIYKKLEETILKKSYLFM